jgi:pimeloyl-ACP methyl ester carboxylesterase
MTAQFGLSRDAHHIANLLLAAFLIALLAVLLCAAPTNGQVAATRPTSQLLEVEVPAPALAGNLLGTAGLQGAAVYLPPSYATASKRRYPTIYLLHGIFDHYQQWLEEGFDAPGIFDRLIAVGEIPELIAVMPDGFNRTGGGFYRNSPVSGNWADYIATDLVDFIDEQFRTLVRPESRAVTGHSMGGYGSIHLGMTRPDVFSVIWAMSPCCLAATDDLGFGNDAWKRAIRFEKPEDLQASLQKGDFYPVAALGLLTAFSPNPGKPPFFVDFPYELVRGETVLIDSLYDAYLDRLPVRQVDDNREALRGLRGLGIGVGLGDQFVHIPKGTLEFSQVLGEQRIPHLLDVYDGDHRQLVAARLEQIILPWIGTRLATESAR